MSFNPMEDNSRWALILTGQVQPTPEEARILAMLKQLGGDVGSQLPNLSTPTPRTPSGSPSALSQLGVIGGNMASSGGALLGAAGGAMQGLDRAAAGMLPGQSVAGGIQDYVKRLQDVGSQAYGAAAGPGAYSPANSMQAEGPAPMSMADYQNAPPITNPSPPPTGPMPNDPESAYSAAYSAASAGGGTSASQDAEALRKAQTPIPKGLGSLGGGGGMSDVVGMTSSGSTPTSSGTYTPSEGSATQEKDALKKASTTSGLPGPNDPGFIGPKQNAETDYSFAYDQAKNGGAGDGQIDWQRTVGEQYEADPESWVQDLFAAKGVHDEYNPYAQRWSQSWAKTMPLLLDFYVMSKGGDPFAANARSQALQEFGPQVMSGKINPAKVLEQALAVAHQNKAVMNSLVELGPDKVMGMRALASGQSNRVASAYNTTLQRRVAEERRRQIAAGPAQANDERYIDIASGRG